MSLKSEAHDFSGVVVSPLQFFSKKTVVAIVIAVVSASASASDYYRGASGRLARGGEGGSDWTYDLGGAVGSYNNYSYSEATLGLNYNFADNFQWRNAVFGRFEQNVSNVYGLDSSVRLRVSALSESGSFGVAAFLGPGYRFANYDYSAPFAEAGLHIKFFGLSIGVGAKALFYSKSPVGGIDSTVLAQMQAQNPNFGQSTTDVVYFLILSGGGML